MPVSAADVAYSAGTRVAVVPVVPDAFLRNPDSCFAGFPDDAASPGHPGSALAHSDVAAAILAATVGLAALAAIGRAVADISPAVLAGLSHRESQRVRPLPRTLFPAQSRSQLPRKPPMMPSFLSFP